MRQHFLDRAISAAVPPASRGGAEDKSGKSRFQITIALLSVLVRLCDRFRDVNHRFETGSLSVRLWDASQRDL
jgi:hypothetical protein